MDYPNAGITAEDTPEEVARKVAQYKRDHPEEYTKGAFTQSQTNRGAANAGISLEDFGKLDTDTQNYFINNEDSINKAKKQIDQAEEDQINPTEIERQISEADIPDAVKDALVRYLWTVFERPKEEQKAEEGWLEKTADAAWQWWNNIWK
jgi:hypothetical protein